MGCLGAGTVDLQQIWHLSAVFEIFKYNQSTNSADPSPTFTFSIHRFYFGRLQPLALNFITFCNIGISYHA